MIRPTTGRHVDFFPGASSIAPGFNYFDKERKTALAAMVVAVHSDRMVNLVVWDQHGHQHQRTSVALMQDDDAAPKDDDGSTGDYCAWMGYQKEQAGKDASADKLKAAGKPPEYQPPEHQPDPNAGQGSGTGTAGAKIPEPTEGKTGTEAADANKAAV